MDNPIRFSDLFGDDIRGGLDALISQVGQVENSLVSMIKDVKKEASGIAEAISGTSSATKGDRDITSQLASEIERLHSANEKLQKSLEYVQGQLKNMKSSKSTDKDGTIDLAKSYESLADIIEETGVNIEELLTSERQLAIAKKNGVTANNALSGSYNKLYAEYNLLKNVLNALSEEMVNNEAIGGRLQKEALSRMNIMKQMQEATGKHTLSVGDYGKALNGLHLSFNQITRELPSLTNSASQFAIAISNNIPLFTDAIKRYSQEHKNAKLAFDELIRSGKTEAEALTALGTSAQFLQSTFKATLGVFKSLAGWIGIVSALIPFLTKAIEKHIKAKKEQNKAIEEGITLEKLDAEALRNAFVEVTRQVNKLDTLYSISQNVNRSWKDRINAAKQLKKEFKEELEGITAENIAMGESKAIIDSLRKSLVKEAEAKAYLNEISNLTIKAYDLEKKAKVSYAKVDTATTDLQIANANRLAGATRIIGESQAAYDARQAILVAKANEAASNLEKVTKEYEAIGEEQKNVAQEISDLKDRIDPSAFDDVTKGVGRGLESIKDFYWQWRESIAQIIKDEENRAIALNDVRYEHSIANMRKELEEQKAKGVLSVEQEKYLTEIMVNLEIERQRKRQEIIWEFYGKTWKAIRDKYKDEVEEEAVDEVDLTISGRYNKILANASTQILASRERLNNAINRGMYKQAKEEGKAFKDLTIEKLRIEAEFQEKLLKMRLETGTITQDQYTIELAKIQTNLDKSIASLNRRRRGKLNIWNMLFGDVKEDGKGNVYKELSEEAQLFTKTFEESMSTAFKYMDEWMDKRIEMAEIAVEAAEKEAEAAKKVYEYEMEARANGYANNVEFARREYEEKMALERKAIAEKERLQKIQEAIDSATQLSSLITATAELWASHASLGPIGPALAAIATTLMWSSFAASKVTAAQMTATKYGDGMSEYLDYGGSHASGNDIDFGADKNGRRRRVERGEMIGVINKRNVEKYGVNRITDIISSLNRGTFENKYSNIVDTIAPEMNADLYHLAFAGVEREGVDLGKVESSLQTLIEQGDTRVVSTPYGRIEYKGNNKRIIRNS